MHIKRWCASSHIFSLFLLSSIFLKKKEITNTHILHLYKSQFGLFPVSYVNVFMEKSGAKGGSPIKTNEAHWISPPGHCRGAGINRLYSFLSGLNGGNKSMKMQHIHLQNNKGCCLKAWRVLAPFWGLMQMRLSLCCYQAIGLGN